MLPSPVPAGPGWDEDLAWLDRDPMTAAEREELLDRICEQDRPPEPEEYEDNNTPYEAGGRTCLCNAGPKCRHDHRLKQHPKWKVEQLPDGTFRWTTPAGRQYTTEPTRYPV